MRGSSLCWLCRHATNKYRACPWSAKLEPVPGWTVKENPKTGGVWVGFCPLWLPDPGVSEAITKHGGTDWCKLANAELYAGERQSEPVPRLAAIRYFIKNHRRRKNERQTNGV